MMDRARWMLVSITIARWILAGTVLVAFVLGYFVGREHLKYEIRKGISEAIDTFSKGLGQAFGGDEAPDQSHESVEATVKAKAVMDAYRPYLKLYEVRASYEHDILDGRVAVVRGKLKNIGNKTLTKVRVTAYFLDTAGNRIYEQHYPPVWVGIMAFEGDTDKPLKPGYIRSFGFKATGCPKEWKPGAVECEIIQIELAEQ